MDISWLQTEASEDDVVDSDFDLSEEEERREGDGDEEVQEPKKKRKWWIAPAKPQKVCLFCVCMCVCMRNMFNPSRMNRESHSLRSPKSLNLRSLHFPLT